MRRLYLGAAIVALLPVHAYGQVFETPEPCFPPAVIYHAGPMFEVADKYGCKDNREHKTEIIVTATRVNHTRIMELTSPVSTFNANELSTYGNSYVADILRKIPGASINRSGPAGGLTQLRLRGTEGNHVLVLVDGVKVSNPNTGEFDFASLRSEDVVHVEVLRGEQSALWGSDAIGGIVNIITRAGETKESYSVSVKGGSFGTGEAQVSAVIPVGNAALSVNGNIFKTEGYDASGLGGEKDGAESRAVNIGLNNVDFGGIDFSGKFSASTAISEFDEDITYNGRLENTAGETTTNTQTGRVSAWFNLAGFENLINLSLTDTKQVTKGTSFPNDTTGKRTQLNWAAEKSWDVHSLTFLAETEEEKFSNFGGAGAGQNQEQSIRNNAVAADYRYNNDAITLTASARQDFNDRFDDSATWRVGAGYAFESIDGRVRVSYGTGVKNPSMTELFGYFPNSFIGNPDVKPEQSKGYSIGYDQAFGGLNFSVDYFRSNLENEITTIFNPNFTSTVINNTTKSKREGVELEARWLMSKTLSARASATFLDTEENGIQELRRPKFMASATVTWQPIEPLSLTLSADHTGDQMDTDFGSFQRVTLDGFTLVGLNATWDVSDRIALSLRGENLLDEEYQEVFGYASQGRGIYAGLRAHF